MSSEKKKRLAPTAIRTSLVKEARVAASTFTTIHNIIHFLSSQLDRIIFILLLVALALTAGMMITIKEMKSDVSELSEDVASIKATQAELRNVAYCQSVGINEMMSALETEGVTIDRPEWLRDIPLSLELQEFTYNACKAYGVDYDMVLAIMEVESRYMNVVSDNGKDYGLCQINVVNHSWLAEEHDLTDMLDEKQNITACVLILADIQSGGEFTAPNEILMAYNMGQSGARKALANGTTETDYTKKVMEVMTDGN
jgi:soluble lytic murein transglycosylase-like protein